MATKDGANGDPLAPMTMDLMAPMVHPIAISAKDNHHWRQLRSSFVINGSILMAPFRGDVSSTIANVINDVIGINGAIGKFGDLLVLMAIYWCHWRH